MASVLLACVPGVVEGVGFALFDAMSPRCFLLRTGLVALILAASTTWGDPYTITPDDKAVIEVGVLSISRNPDSAKFELMAAFKMRDRSGTVVRSSVDSKNGLGRLTGWKFTLAGETTGSSTQKGHRGHGWNEGRPQPLQKVRRCGVSPPIDRFDRNGVCTSRWPRGRSQRRTKYRLR
jgi:hypothetical protein